MIYASLDDHGSSTYPCCLLLADVILLLPDPDSLTSYFERYVAAGMLNTGLVRLPHHAPWTLRYPSHI